MDFYFIVLAVLFTLSSVFWAVVCMKLINKLMSKNYSDYKIAESIGSKTPIIKNKTQGEPLEDMGSLAEFNA